MSKWVQIRERNHQLATLLTYDTSDPLSASLRVMSYDLRLNSTLLRSIEVQPIGGSQYA
jgi:hypothetical protein